MTSLTGPAGRWQIATRPAIQPRWTRGGRELMFEGFDGNIFAVDIDTRNGFHASRPRQLFAVPAAAPNPGTQYWCVDATGERIFALSPAAPGGGKGSIEVFTDFHSLGNRK